ncbi:MAG: hypothetical protein Q4C54_06825 [Clostridia bacterium]|nr:hypothetical protein [Clostridia bacterium]
MRKWIALVLSILLSVSLCLPMQAMAALNEDLNDKECGAYYYIPQKGKTAVISYYSQFEETEDVVIPAKMDGRQVTGIRTEAFAYNESVRSVTIP